MSDRRFSVDQWFNGEQTLGDMIVSLDHEIDALERLVEIFRRRKAELQAKLDAKQREQLARDAAHAPQRFINDMHKDEGYEKENDQ